MSSHLENSLIFHGQPMSQWLAALRSADPGRRQEAGAAWRQLGQMLKGLIPLLGEPLKDPRPEVRLQAVQTLRDLGIDLQPLGMMVRSALKETALQDSDDAVRAEAVEALNRHLEPQTRSQVPALIEALKDQVAPVRFSAASALADLGKEGRAAVTALIHAAMWDAEFGVRVQAAVAMWRIDRRDRIAVPILVQALQASDDYLRWIAADCLGDIGPDAQDAVPALQEALRDEYRTPLIRESLLLALQRIDPGAASRA